MSYSFDEMLSSFDRMSGAEQARFVKEICLRVGKGEDSSLIDELHASGAAIFRMYDEEEERHGKAETW